MYDYHLPCIWFPSIPCIVVKFIKQLQKKKQNRKGGRKEWKGKERNMGCYKKVCDLMEYYSAIKRKEILPFATTWMDLEGIILSEISQAVKDKHQLISLICGV